MASGGGEHGVSFDVFRSLCGANLVDAVVRGPSGDDSFLRELVPRTEGVVLDAAALADELSSSSDEEGDDVVIPATLWVLLDINPPQLGTVTIEGKLSFEDLKDLTLDATSVVVWGTLAIGSAHQPHTHEAVIRLHGVRTSPSVVLDNKLFLGNKVMPVLGELQLHGRPMVRSWVKLAETADADDTTLRLVPALNALAPVLFHPSHREHVPAAFGRAAGDRRFGVCLHHSREWRFHDLM